MAADGSSTGVTLELDAIQLGPIATNCYLVRQADAAEAVVVDPGAEAERVLELARDRGARIAGILVTHCHYDHVGAVAALVSATGAPVWMSSLEAPVLEQPEEFRFGGLPSVDAATVDHRLDGGEQIEVAGITFDVLSTPGHSPGHLTFVVDGVTADGGDSFETPPVAFVGDVVFQGSVGRTDLPFADGATLQHTLGELRRRLHPDTVLLPGHGGPTTLRAELESNPFLRDI